MSVPKLWYRLFNVQRQHASYLARFSYAGTARNHAWTLTGGTEFWKEFVPHDYWRVINYVHY